MYKIPANIDLSFLIGAELDQISITLSQVYFKFDPEGVISIGSAMEVIDGGSAFAWDSEKANIDLPIKKLFGTKVLKYTVENDRTLVVAFDNGVLLRIYDNSDQYESFQISDKSGDRYII